MDNKNYTRGQTRKEISDSINSRQQNKGDAILEKLPKILLTVAIVIALLLILGTIAAYSVKKDDIGSNYRKADPTPQKVENLARKTSDKVSTYTEMGQIRTVTKAPEGKSQGTILVVSPWFSYPQGDTVFFEELSQKDRMLQSLIMEYFSQHTERELRSTGELEVKRQLKELINQQLVLGKIKEVYFEEYIFFE